MNYTDMSYRMQDNTVSDNKVLAMAFVNVQDLDSVYDAETGFSNGTIFPALNKPLAVWGLCK